VRAEGWQVLRQLKQEGADLFTRREHAVIDFVFCRTYMFSKRSERISRSHFLKGVYAKDGQLIAAPCGLSANTLEHALTALEKKGALLRAMDAGKITVFSLNPIWSAHAFRLRLKAKICKEASKKQVDPPQNLGVHPPQKLGVVPTPKIGDHNIQNKINRFEGRARSGAIGQQEENSVTMAIKDDLLAVATSATEKHHAARDRKKQRGNATALLKCWEAAYIEAYPDDRWYPWRTYEIAAYRKALVRCVPQADWIEFTDFAVQSFKDVITTRLRWMCSPPQLPTVGFVIKHCDSFYEAFLDRRDPNRRSRARLARATSGQQPEPVPDTVEPFSAALAAENEALKKRLADAETKLAQTRRTEHAKAKKLFTTRKPKRDPEFGEW
jgi:DNA-binding transcriptional ArsR family regulator